MEFSIFDETIANVVVGIMIWLFYVYIFRVITRNFHINRYHEKIQDFLFYWYISESLSGRTPWIKIQHLVNPEKSSAWSMKKLVKKGSTLKIQTEAEARIAAKKLFRNVAKPGSEFIELGDLARFLPEIDALATLSIFDDGISEGETTQISCLSLQDFMVYAFRLEKSLVLSMKDTDSIISRVRVVLYLVAGIAQAFALLFSEVLGGYGAQLFLMFLPCLVFPLPSPGKLKESLIFFFFERQCDVGERCVIDGVELVVKKINLTSTIFVRPDRRSIRLSNSALLHKLISTYEGSARLEKMELILS